MLTRFAKTKLVAEWDTALQNLRVCNKIPYRTKTEQGTLNCGRCEKCIRTMVALAALGALDRTRAFPEREVSADLIGTIPSLTPAVRFRLYLDLFEPLKQSGREDLVQAIEQLFQRSRPMEVVDIVKRKLVDLDHHYLHGWLGRMKRLAGSVAHPALGNSNGLNKSVPGLPTAANPKSR
jgi:hypothetical protein